MSKLQNMVVFFVPSWDSCQCFCYQISVGYALVDSSAIVSETERVILDQIQSLSQRFPIVSDQIRSAHWHKL